MKMFPLTRRIGAAGLLAAALTSARTGVIACGDKFLVVSRGTRFDRAAPLRDASILIYANPATALAKDFAQIPLESTLRKAGYSPTIVTDAQGLDRALAKGDWALVLMDAKDVQDVRSRMRGSATLLPVLHDPTSDAFKQAKKQYHHVLKSPAKSRVFLDAIDEALAAKPGKTTN
jgi:hypothetical protein